MALFPTSIPANFTEATSENQNNPKVISCDVSTDHLSFTVIPVYVLLICVLGIILNVFVLTIFLFHKKACTVAEIYLTNLAAADLLLMSCLPFWAQNVALHYEWPFGNALCKLVSYFIRMNFLCSIYFLVLVSSDRYLALVHPLSFERIRRPFCAKLGCLLVWGFGCLLSLPTLIYRQVKAHDASNRSECVAYPAHIGYGEYVAIEVVNIVVGFIIPLLIIFFCTVRIIHALRNRVNTRQKECKATVLILAVLLAFLICWGPFQVVRIIEVLMRVGILPGCYYILLVHHCQQVVIYLGFFNSVLNPILYVVVGNNFREKAREVSTGTFRLISRRGTLSRSMNTVECTS